MKPYLTGEHPIRFAHRGSRLLWPENTMAAFQGAVDLGYRYLETDLHVSRDGRVVVFHDDTLERLTDGRGQVWRHDWDELRRLDTGYRFEPEPGHHPWRGRGLGIPLLEEVLRTFPEIRLNLDLKQAGTAAAVAAEIDRLGVEERVLVGAFYDVRVRAFRRHSAGKVATAAGPGEVLAALAAARVGRVRRPVYDALQIPERIVNPRLVRTAHAAGVQVHVWTVNDPPAMHRLLDLGVDGIVSDRPDLLAAVVASRSG